ncbi:unnamed protein product [Ceratitis capitata]|uniref:(Mediterranean fruit fly) hypothetical protein n=1 Tax=Ceratitis capitata TaxID=7213 RepID=A0A811UKJ3_CERCA|nr:unnamed protein product [Ceratitis capitata]
MGAKLLLLPPLDEGNLNETKFIFSRLSTLKHSQHLLLSPQPFLVTTNSHFPHGVAPTKTEKHEKCSAKQIDKIVRTWPVIMSTTVAGYARRPVSGGSGNWSPLLSQLLQ